MTVAKSDEGQLKAPSPAVSNPAVRRKIIRKPGDAPSASAVRLDDLYRLAMPKLFATAEREGIAEHNGMNRAQLIVGIVPSKSNAARSCTAPALSKCCLTATASCAARLTITWHHQKTFTFHPAKSDVWG